MRTPDRCEIMERVEEKMRRALLYNTDERPFTTLTFAQSLDGSIAAASGLSLPLSNAHSLRMTHCLRARHEAILVGINTVLTDDPRLTVRLVEGRDPQPVVVDSLLRFPLQAKLLRDGCRSPLIATTQAACEKKERDLRRAGADIIRLPADENGWVDLRSLLGHLRLLGLRSLMVEGGARIITSFLRARLADQIILTVAPVFVGGMRAVNSTPQSGVSLPQLTNLCHVRLDDDIVIMADLAQDGACLAQGLPQPNFCPAGIPSPAVS